MSKWHERQVVYLNLSVVSFFYKYYSSLDIDFEVSCFLIREVLRKVKRASPFG